jgi:hypothetical protein
MRFPIVGGFGMYARGGVEREWTGSLTSISALRSGKAGGLGFEYRVSLPLLGKAGVWTEISDDRIDTDNGTRNVPLWTTGVMLGL